MDLTDTPPRRSRFWLFAPFAILTLAALGWSVAWFVIRGRTTEALDAWLANEAVAGRRWDCPERTVRGFPVRIEIACARIGLQSRDIALSAGRLATITQIYQPRHTIVELEGPLKASGQGIAVEATWTDLRASIHTAKDGLQRASLSLAGPSVKAAGLPVGELAGSARRAEAHLRPSPSLPAESAFDLATSLAGAAVPALDQLLGGPEPLDAELQATLTQARLGPARGPRDALESWREAGGRILVTRLDLAKGPRRLEAKGELGLDGQRRPAGRVDIAAAGMGDLLAALTGGRAPGGAGGNAAAGLLGNLLQPRPRQAPPGGAPGAADSKPALAPLPPLRLDNGRVLMGPFTVPGLRLQPLY